MVVETQQLPVLSIEAHDFAFKTSAVSCVWEVCLKFEFTHEDAQWRETVPVFCLWPAVYSERQS
jgi:hypothetical protein